MRFKRTGAGARTWLAIAVAMAGLAIVRSGPLSAVPPQGVDPDAMPGVTSSASKEPEGARIYAENCAACHEKGTARAPLRIILANLTPTAIVTALTSGSMQAQGAALDAKQKDEVARFLSGAATDEAAVAAANWKPAPCPAENAAFDRMAVPAFTGWGLDHAGTHSVSGSKAGISRSNVGQLKLKWAFGFPSANRARSQPAIGGGAIFVGSHDGRVFALDRKTGCVRWSYTADAEVRTGIVLSSWEAGDTNAMPLAYFGDWRGNAYAVEAFTGKQVWKVHADEHPAAVITAAPALYGDTLYVPVSSLEEASAASPDYACCTFRGSILALDANTGRERWQTWLVGEPKSQPETKQLGPSGVPVWAGLAIDEQRGHLIIATGDNYTQPATELSDAIVALDLMTGKIAWHHQATEGDAWNVGCMTPSPANCPEDAGPDYDFGAGPAVARGNDGHDYVLAGQKSGAVHAVYAADGRHAWTTQVGRGGMAGGIHFGIATESGRVFVPVSDLGEMPGVTEPPRPGLYALDIATGQQVWAAPSPKVCGDKPLCIPGYGGAITATPELVLAGSDDGHVRAFDAASGKVLWDFDTARSFETVNGIAAHGGAISGGVAPVVDGGQLIVASGYGFVSKMPGNVLLVFEEN